MDNTDPKAHMAAVGDFNVAELDDEVLDSTTNKSYSQGQLVLRRFLRHRAAMISLVVFLFIIVLAFSSIGFGPVPGWWKYGYESTHPIVNDRAPTLGWFTLGEHPMGQDTAGKDYFALIMRGTQRSIIIAFIVGIVSTLIGTIIGALSGYLRGWVETILMRMTDLFIVIPLLLLAAVVGQLASERLGGGIIMLALLLGFLSWTSLARLVRGEVLSLREREFVYAAQALGASTPRIIIKHILPNALGTIIVSATLAIAAAILLETSLSFLGFGVKSPDTSLGLLISQYQQKFSSQPWLFYWPAGLILAIALSVNFIGDGLRDAFDPRQKGKAKRFKKVAKA